MSALYCSCGVSPQDPSPGCTEPHETAGVSVLEPVSTKPAWRPFEAAAKTPPPKRWRGRTAIELYKDGHREVYHMPVTKRTGAWTHADTKASRKTCEACTP